MELLCINRLLEDGLRAAAVGAADVALLLSDPVNEVDDFREKLFRFDLANLDGCSCTSVDTDVRDKLDPRRCGRIVLCVVPPSFLELFE